MSRNEDLLLVVSDCFTEKALQDILAKSSKEKRQDVKVLSWDFGTAAAKGDSYLSTVNRILVKGEVKGNPIDVKIVVKSLPKNVGRRKTFRSADFFYNEITFYEEVIFLIQTQEKRNYLTNVLVNRFLLRMRIGRSSYESK